MFQSEQFIYIQMPKTGSAHIVILLSELFDGEEVGKHNAAKKEQVNSGRFFISSIRSPWDWYLSLYTFGVLEKGGVWRRLTTEKQSYPSAKSVIKSPFKELSKFLKIQKDTKMRRNLYDKNCNIASFRRWLKFVHDTNNKRLLGEGYGKTVITGLCGFMTYRYLRLCCQNIGELRKPDLIRNYNDLVQFDRRNCYIDFFIHQESLEDDLCKAVENIRSLSIEEKERIYSAEKINISNRSLLISDYYDREAIDLVYNRERFLIEKFGYSPPELAEQSAALDGL